jgi:glycosyltransferase involved in cell wall biosynthesis
MKPITFILFTYNEEKRIAFAIKNLIGYGPVILMDGGSTDGTQKIAESMGAVFVSRPPSSKANVETEENFIFIKKIIKTNWIYWGYVDNIAPKTLLEKMIELAQEDTYKKILIPIQTYLWGNTKHVILKSHAPMLFHKDFTTFIGNYIHGMGKFTGTKDQVLTLPNIEKYALKHFSTYNINKFVAGHMRYAEAEALEKFKAGKKFSTLRMILAMFRYWWIYRRCLKLGSLGLIILLDYSFFRVMSYAKLYELENNIDLTTIEESYSLAKQKILQEFNDIT